MGSRHSRYCGFYLYKRSNFMKTDLSIVIPAYNRIELLKYSLKSISSALGDFSVETIVVDDGSTEPLEHQLKGFSDLPIRFIRQPNQGSIVARYRGLQEAAGRYVLFLDSDDLVHPDKLTCQLRCLEDTEAEVCYTDDSTVQLEGDYSSLEFQPSRVLPHTTSPAHFYLKVQPIPVNPIYRRDYLMEYLKTPIVPMNRIYDAVGDVWLYYNLAPYPAHIEKVDGHYSIYGEHDLDRYTNHWEKLGVASLSLMWTFFLNCPRKESTLEARQFVGECALISWRRLPRNFHADFERTMLEIWENAPKGDLNALGGKLFQTLAKVIGVSLAASCLRRLQRPDYATIRTMNSEELNELMMDLATIKVG